jgi:1,4-dihydroxy-2-naphthoyl-CoA hydrolase
MIIQESLQAKIDWYFKEARKHMGHALNIEFKEIHEDLLIAEMPVDDNTVQPFGILHGGASVVLAETLASVGAWLNAGEGKTAVGVEINANHIRSVKHGGRVSGRATPIKRGRNIQVWETEIRDQNEKLVCISRCTLAVVSMRK